MALSSGWSRTLGSRDVRRRPPGIWGPLASRVGRGGSGLGAACAREGRHAAWRANARGVAGRIRDHDLHLATLRATSRRALTPRGGVAWVPPAWRMQPLGHSRAATTLATGCADQVSATRHAQETTMFSKTRLVLVLALGLACIASGGCEPRSGSAATTPIGLETATNSRTRMVAVVDRQFCVSKHRNRLAGVLFLQRFRGTMDDWDPALLDAVATSHRVIVFDNSRVSTSAGEVATTLEAAADDAVVFCPQPRNRQGRRARMVDGGLIAQEVAIRHPDFASGKRSSSGPFLPDPRRTPTQQLFATTARKPVYSFEDQVTLFFTQSEASRKAAQRSLDRMAARTVDREAPVSVRRVHESDSRNQKLPRRSGSARKDRVGYRCAPFLS